MSSPILSPCVGLTKVFGRAQKFGLTHSQLAVLIAIKALKSANYDSIATSAALSTHTLRGACSPLQYLADEKLIESENQMDKETRRRKNVYALTELGEEVLHVIISGRPAERPSSVNGQESLGEVAR